MGDLPRSRTLTIAVVGLALSGCGRGDDTPPTGPDAADLGIVIVSGDGQRGMVGTSLPRLLVVQVRIGGGEPAEDVPVVWSVLEGGGQLSLKGHLTDREGLAAAVLFLGDQPGEQVIRAAVESGAEVLFTADAVNSTPQLDRARPAPRRDLH